MKLNADCMNENKLSSLTNLSRKETDFCSKVSECLFWLEESSFGGRNQETVIQRANTLLIIVPNSSACCAKTIQPTSHWPTIYPLIKVYCRGGVSLHMSAPILYLFMMMFSMEDSGSQRAGMLLSQMME